MTGTGIKRYSGRDVEDGAEWGTPDGEWVTYEDHAAKVAEMEKENLELRCQVDYLKDVAKFEDVSRLMKEKDELLTRLANFEERMPTKRQMREGASVIDRRAYETGSSYLFAVADWLGYLASDAPTIHRDYRP